MPFLNIILLLKCILVVVKTQEVNHSEVLGISIVSCEQVGETVRFSDGLPIFVADEQQELTVYGINLHPETRVGYTRENNCENVSPVEFKVEENTGRHIALVTFTTPHPDQTLYSQTRYYICVKHGEGNWTLLDERTRGFFVYQPFFTPVIFAVMLLFSYSLSCLMSGLNIGLFTLDPQELELLKCAGTAKQKKNAQTVLPVRRCGNFLLCSILITVTLCNAISTVSANQFFSEWITVVMTTIIIVLICEIIPQSVCTTYPLTIGANTIYITKVCMLLTSPISYPLGKILDRVLGKESLLGTYSKERLQELLKLSHLATDEVNIISGTLRLSGKTAEDIMTMSNDMFKLPITAVLDFETVATILASGYSRIPIYVGDSSNIQYILLTKDLALLDPQDRVPVKVLVQNTKLKCYYVSKCTTVDKLLEIFKDSRCHMVFVLESRNWLSLGRRRTQPDKEVDGSSSEHKKVIGLVTFEDVIEEIFQMEINDETDKYSDNRIKIRLPSDHDLPNIYKKPSKPFKPSANLKLAVFNFLSGIDEFSNSLLSPKVLRVLLNFDIYYTVEGKKLPQDAIYLHGVPADYFVMILEGEMEVEIGSEGLTFEVGAFHYFGLDSLKRKGTFVPDYKLIAVKQTTYIKIDKNMYEAAILATKFERSRQSPNITGKSEVLKYYQKLIG